MNCCNKNKRMGGSSNIGVRFCLIFILETLELLFLCLEQLLCECQNFICLLVVSGVMHEPHWKNRSKPYNGLTMVFCWFVKSSGLKKIFFEVTHDSRHGMFPAVYPLSISKQCLCI